MNMDLLYVELRRDEGVKYSPYKDTKNISTVGVGHNLVAAPLPGAKYPLTDEQVDAILKTDLQAVFKALDANLPWWRSLDEVRQRVLANMCFNMGIGTLLQFKNTLAAMRSCKYALAAGGMRSSAWAAQVGERAERLAKAMESGLMPK